MTKNGKGNELPQEQSPGDPSPSEKQACSRCHQEKTIGCADGVTLAEDGARFLVCPNLKKESTLRPLPDLRGPHFTPEPPAPVSKSFQSVFESEEPRGKGVTNGTSNVA